MIKFNYAPVIGVALFISLATSSCNRVSETGKKVINKTGEAVGKGVSEFAKGVEEGVSESYDCKLEKADAVVKLGLETGKFRINVNSSNKKNILSVYFMFMADFNRNIKVTVHDKNGIEYGRSFQTIKKLKGEAQFFDFIFDDKVEIENKSTFVIDLSN